MTKKINGQRGYVLAQVFNLNDTSMLRGGEAGREGEGEKLRTKSLLQFFKYQRTVSPFPSLTVLSTLENEKNSDIVDSTQLTMSAISRGLQIKKA